MDFFFRITGIAIFDGINPTIILLTLYLLAGYRPKVMVPVYIVSIYLTNLSLGLILYFYLGTDKFSGFTKIIHNKNPYLYAIKALLSIVLLISAYKIDVDKTRKVKKEPELQKGLLSVAFLGIIGTIIEFSTAVSYIVGIRLLAQQHYGALAATSTLLYYNAVYIIFPVAIYVTYLRSRQHADAVLKKLHSKSSFYLNHFFRITFAIIGLILVFDCLNYFMRNPFLREVRHLL